jgi:thiol-disulfide isomerase/thioredoxin
MNPRAAIFAGIVVLVGLGGFLLLQTTTVTSSGAVRVGHVPVAAASCHDDDNCLPEFTARAVDGRELSRADFAGKPVLVNFWATWCGPCVKEIPALQATYEQLGAQGFAILAIAQDGTEDQIAQFAIDHYITYAVVRANPTLDYAFGGKPQLLPTSFLYGSDGHLQRQWQGGIAEKELSDAVLASAVPANATK